MPGFFKNLTIKSKFSLLLLIAALWFIVFIFIINHFVLFKSYNDLEIRNAGVNLRRVVSSIEREVYSLGNVCHDWASWNDMYAFLADHNVDFITSNFTYATFMAGNFNHISIIDKNNKIVFAEGYKSGKRKKTMPVFLTDPSFVLGSGILSFEDTDIAGQHKEGIIITEYGFMFIAVRPVLTSDNTGPVRGYVIMGKYLDDYVISNLREQTELDFSIIDINDKTRHAYSSIIDELMLGRSRSVTNISDNIYTYALQPDIYDRNAYLLQVVTPKIIIREGNKVIIVSVLILISAMILMLSIIWMIVNIYILKPIDMLKKQIHSITREDYKKESRLNRNDELGLLSLVIDDMASTINSRRSELKSANAKLGFLTITDSLTGIYNRRHFDEVVRSEWKRAYRNRKPVSILICDIDFFKDYNDTYGHQAGDGCIIMIAGMLEGMLNREGDRAFRYGGEEFAAILPDADLDGAVKMAVSFLNVIAGIRKEHESSAFGIVTVSIGVASAVPDNKLHALQLIDMADSALYKSKERGRNRVHSAEKKENGDVVYTEYAANL